MALEYSWTEMSRNKRQANALSSAAAVGGRLRRAVRHLHIQSRKSALEIYFDAK